MSVESLEKGMFPKVCRDTDYVNQKSIRCELYYPILKKCLENVQMGKSTADFFISMGVSRVGLYAVNEFMDYILRDGNISKLKNLLIYDLHYEKYHGLYYGRSVLPANQVIHDYKESNIEKVVICNLVFADDIYRYLNGKGIRAEDIMTIDTLIYGM
ncbi:MAG: hypothetical protein E7306_07035 [Butyrivibrio sp.]|nr:hypothetical protein [Butyrivibrio sp.]